MMATNGRVSHGRPWDEEADATLRRLVQDGALLPEIARTLGRTQEAVRSRANIMKLPVRSSLGRGRRVLSPPTLP